jgi:hypothetical protein
LRMAEEPRNLVFGQTGECRDAQQLRGCHHFDLLMY